MRDIPVGNGSLLVTFDDKYQIRDVYFPHVGQENHTEGFPFRFGGWVRGQSQQNLSFVRFKKYAHGLLQFDLSWDNLTTYYVALGEKDKAFELLNKRFENRRIRPGALVDPRLDSLRDDPRFEELVKRVGVSQ